MFSDPSIRSFFLVLVGEMGDKTQLLALFLASRFRRPWTVMAGIFCATVLNHLLAATMGGTVARLLPEAVIRWTLIITFVGFAVWVLFPDKETDSQKPPRYGVFVTTVVSFFLAEMGDKTQLLTVALGAQYKDIMSVTLGTTAGMMVADGIAVWLGQKFLNRIPLVWVRIGASILFALFGLGIYLHH